jgi:hypothetical protein
MWPARGRVLPRGGPRPSDLQRAPAYPVTPDRPKVSLEIMNIDGMTLCEREARGERAQSRRSVRDVEVLTVELWSSRPGYSERAVCLTFAVRVNGVLRRLYWAGNDAVASGLPSACLKFA